MKSIPTEWRVSLILLAVACMMSAVYISDHTLSLLLPCVTVVCWHMPIVPDTWKIVTGGSLGLQAVTENFVKNKNSNMKKISCQIIFTLSVLYEPSSSHHGVLRQLSLSLNDSPLPFLGLILQLCCCPSFPPSCARGCCWLFYLE